MLAIPGQSAHLPGKEPVWLAHDGKADGAVRNYSTVIVQASPMDLYKFFSDPALGPRWMERITSAERTANDDIRWTMLAGAKDDKDAKTYTWTTRVVSDVPGEKLAWRSTGGDIEEAGEVTFRELSYGRGTEVLLISEVRVPGGKVAALTAGLMARSPEQAVIEDLRHFKALVETGEVPTTEGQPHGPRGISGGIKEIMYGENNPTPPGTQDQA